MREPHNTIPIPSQKKHNLQLDWHKRKSAWNCGIKFALQGMSAHPPAEAGRKAMMMVTEVSE